MRLIILGQLVVLLVTSACKPSEDNSESNVRATSSGAITLSDPANFVPYTNPDYSRYQTPEDEMMDPSEFSKKVEKDNFGNDQIPAKNHL